MSDPRGELVDLAAELRAVLLANQAQGHRHDPAPQTAGAGGSRASEPQTALQAVRDELGDCTRCGLCAARRSIVFGVGDPKADLMIVGEAPGFHEDRLGEPFVGEAGKMLDRMLERVLFLERSQVYIANIVKCRPPDNRNPTAEEIATCLPFLHAQIRAVAPKVMLALGNVAFKTLFDTRAGITKSRGQWRTFEGIPVMPTFHPAYLLRQPKDKRLTFEDLKAVRARYESR